jgi:hypothetical protein
MKVHSLPAFRGQECPHHTTQNIRLLFAFPKHEFPASLLLSEGRSLRPKKCTRIKAGNFESIESVMAQSG